MACIRLQLAPEGLGYVRVHLNLTCKFRFKLSVGQDQRVQTTGSQADYSLDGTAGKALPTRLRSVQREGRQATQAGSGAKKG